MLTELCDIGHTVVIDLQRTEIIIYLTHLLPPLVLDHTLPVLERSIDKCLRRYSDDGIIEITHLHRCQCNILHLTVGSCRWYGNPVTDMQHLVGCQTDACHQSLDGILEDEHQDGRGSTQSCKECRRILIDDDGDHHDGGNEDHKNLQYAADAVDILSARGTGIMFQLLKRVDEDDDGPGHHDGEVDGRQSSHDHLYLRILKEHQRQQDPDDDGRNDTAGRCQHLLTEEHIIPLCVCLTRNFQEHWHYKPATQPTRQPCQQEGSHHQYRITHYRHVVSRQSR